MMIRYLATMAAQTPKRLRAGLAVAGVLGLMAGTAEAQTLSPWEFKQGESVVALPKGVLSRKGAERLQLVYNYAKVPTKNDAWKAAPTDGGGKISYGSTSSSRIPQSNYDKFTQVDFTYFRAFLDVPRNYAVNEASVTIGQVDDQARMILFNSKHIDGYYKLANDGKRGGMAVKTDFTGELVPGEVNTFVIVQVDDNPGGNILKGGITVSLNNAEVKPDPAFAAKLKPFMNQPGYTAIQFKKNGAAVGENTTAFVLTPAQKNKAGAVWTLQEIDWKSSFTIRAEIYLGSAAGGDGLALVFQDLSSDKLGQGGGLGYAGITPSFAIEFDTYSNAEYGDPQQNHVAARTDGKPQHSAGDFKALSKPLTDGQFHPVEFTWNAGTQKFDLKLDGAAQFTSQSFPSNSFGGQKVYFGFTAATGEAVNEHKVRNITVSK